MKIIDKNGRQYVSFGGIVRSLEHILDILFELEENTSIVMADKTLRDFLEMEDVIVANTVSSVCAKGPKYYEFLNKVETLEVTNG